MLAVAAILYFSGLLDQWLNKATEPVAQPVVVKSDPVPIPVDSPQIEEEEVVTTPSASDTASVIPVTPDPIPETQAPVVSFLVHVASFQHEIDAQKYATTLKAEGHTSTVEHSTVSGQDWSRVYVGPFLNEDDAKADVEILKQDNGLTYFPDYRNIELRVKLFEILHLLSQRYTDLPGKLQG